LKETAMVSNFLYYQTEKGFSCWKVWQVIGACLTSCYEKKERKKDRKEGRKIAV
jgi:hypothetical protein